MTLLYIFPHPDDESFGIGHAIAQQARQGHDIRLLTLTKGGATKVRHELGYTVEEMGIVREKELRAAAERLGISEVTVLDFPDGGLKELDPRELEAAIQSAITKIKPAIVITYPVHGISGFHDHLVTHAAVKRIFVELQSGGAAYLKRLAFFTVTQEKAGRNTGSIKLQGSAPGEIDCVFPVEGVDIDTCKSALDCYTTYRTVIESSKIKALLEEQVVFEIFKESFNPPLEDLTDGV